MPHARVAYQTTYILIEFIFCIKIHVTTKNAIFFVQCVFTLYKTLTGFTPKLRNWINFAKHHS